MASTEDEEAAKKTFTLPEGFVIPAHRHALPIGTTTGSKPQARPGSEQVEAPAPTGFTHDSEE